MKNMHAVERFTLLALNRPRRRGFHRAKGNRGGGSDITSRPTSGRVRSRS